MGNLMEEKGAGQGPVKKFMLVNRKAPYGTVYALEGLEVALISAAYEQEVCLAFMDDGVYQLMKGNDTKGLEMKNFSITYQALDGLDINRLYVERASLEARGLKETDLVVPVTLVDSAEMADLMARQDMIISF